jgi:phosphoribosylglycinamide formyltransferase-1
MQRIAIFASGTGTNADKIIAHFSNTTKNVLPALVVCNKPTAGVISIAAKRGVEVLLIEKEQFLTGDGYVDFFKKQKIDFIVLAGFLWKIPATLIAAYPDKIINIHPALLPKYGGKGMYGNNVHAAVIANKEKESGITIHFVNEHYDEGAIIFQATTNVEENDTPETLAKKIHALEHQYFATTIEHLLNTQ